MSLRHAILTALLERPSSGLDLARRFDKSIRYFWQATHQSIYRELGWLESAHWVESVPQPPSRGKRKLYRVLPAGRSALVDWVAQNEEPAQVRDALLVRLRASSMVGLGPLLQQMREHHAAHARQHAEYLEIAERDFADVGTDPSAQIRLLILEAGIGLENFWMTWLSDAIDRLAAIDPGDQISDR